MIHVLTVSSKKNIFNKLNKAFSANKITHDWTDSGQKALALLSKEKFNLYITHEQLTDMTGRQLIEKVLFKNAMMDSVVLSDLSKEDFHEAYEGLGVLMQFPLEPGKQHVRNLMEHLDRIASIARQTNQLKGD